MEPIQDSDEGELMRRAEQGDGSALGELLQRHRDRLRRMIAVRLDSAIVARVDPSDVVQETFLEAARRLPDYYAKVPIPFYPWLRQIAWQRLVHIQAKHVNVQRRSVNREEPAGTMLSDASVAELAERFAASGTSPSRNLAKKELRFRVRQALAQLTANDREILILRYLEQLSIEEISAVLRISKGAVGMRQVRALERLHQLLDDLNGTGQPR